METVTAVVGGETMVTQKYANTSDKDPEDGINSFYFYEVSVKLRLNYVACSLKFRKDGKKKMSGGGEGLRGRTIVFRT